MYEQQPPNVQQPAFPPPPDSAAGSAIAVTLKYHPLAFLLGLFKPQTQLNGHLAANAWGRHVLAVPPGQYHLHIHVPYLLPPQLGPADLPVNVYPGQTVELEYRAPMIAFSKGALGPPPQKYPGMPVMIALMVVMLIFLICICGGVIAGAVSDSSASSLPAFDVLRQVVGILLR